MQYFYYASNLTTVFLSLGLAFFILSKGRRTTNILFCLYSLCVAGWAALKFLSWNTAAPWDLLWMRLSVAVAVFIPVIYFHFSIIFTNRSRKKLYWVYPAAFLLLVFSFSPLMVIRLGMGEGIKTIDPGPFYLVFWLFFGTLIGLGFFNFYQSLKRADLVRKNQIKYLMLASIIGFGGGMLVFVSNLFPRLEPIGYGFVPLYSLIATYAIVKHRLLDINIVIRGGIIYSILTLLITGIYFFGFTIFRDSFATLTEVNSFFMNFALILLFVFLFQPLRSKIQEIVDKTFYKEKIDREKAIIAFSNQAMGILELGELLDFILRRIKEVLKIKWATIYIRDEKSQTFFDQDLNNLESIYVHKLKESFDVIFLSEKELLLPIFLKKELLGVLHLREKHSEDTFSLFDVELLKTFLNQAAAALKNAFLLNEIVEHKQQLYKASNLASLGTLAAGMAHEIKNPLAVIKGLSQILPENLDDQEFLGKFVSIVPRQIDRINTTIDALLKIGKGPALKKAEVNLNNLLMEIVEFVKVSFKKKNIIIQTDFSRIKPIAANYNMLYQAFFNLIQNSSQAMPEGGVITLRTLSDARVEIEDSGLGISQDQIDHIFSPFVTSRENGVGLGLFMVKKILENHDASVVVESGVGKGTIFKVDFSGG